MKHISEWARQFRNDSTLHLEVLLVSVRREALAEAAELVVTSPYRGHQVHPQFERQEIAQMILNLSDKP